MYAIAYAADGQIAGAVIDSLEFDTQKGKDPSIIQISGYVYAIAYPGDRDDGHLATVTIATDGQIANAVIDSYEYDNQQGKVPDIIPISGDVYAVAYGGRNDDGFIKTITIGTDGQITDPAIATFEFDTSTGKPPKIIPVAGVYVIVYEGPGTDVFLQTLQILTDGTIP